MILVNSKYYLQTATTNHYSSYPSDLIYRVMSILVGHNIFYYDFYQ